MFKKLAGLTAIAGLFIAGTASADITGSAHDFSGQAYTNEICNVCHAPHAGNLVNNAPLWSHDTSTGPWTMYANPATIDGTIDATPGGVSLLCLSCHDGTVAVDSFGGATGSVNVTGDALVGTDLSNDHPISITYAGDLDLAAASAASGITGGTTIDADMLFSGKVECASCHDVHNAFNVNDLLKKSNANSDLCLTCHTK
jgi:predicted CXXCH cytochrome family protein